MRQQHQARPFVARIRHGENHSTVEVEGEVDLVTADRFHDAIDEAVRVSLFVDVDLRHVTFMGSVGLQALLDAQVADFPPLVLVEPSPPVVRLLELAEVADLFPVRRDRPMAIVRLE